MRGRERAQVSFCGAHRYLHELVLHANIPKADGWAVAARAIRCPDERVDAEAAHGPRIIPGVVDDKCRTIVRADYERVVTGTFHGAGDRAKHGGAFPVPIVPVGSCYTVGNAAADAVIRRLPPAAAVEAVVLPV